VPSYTTATVTAVLLERPGLQRVELDSGRRAYVLTQLIGPVRVGDPVVVNTTAVELGLGTGGWDVVHWNLARKDWSEPGGGHVLKLRYTSLQADTGVAEEHSGESDESGQAGGPTGSQAGDLGGIPVVACDLHSQVACVARGFASASGGHRRLVYVMTDSAALPLALSDVVAAERQTGVLSATVTCGQAFGGDFEAVNLHSGLLVARGRAEADAIVVGPGPGVVGTASPFGFSGLEVATVVDAAARLGGRPVVALRVSSADARHRHKGISHHTRTALALAAHRAMLAVPGGEPAPDDLGEVHAVDVDDVVGRGLSSMGRTPEEDPQFFRYALAAGVLAAQLVAKA
jgi:hypothetical protein